MSDHLITDSHKAAKRRRANDRRIARAALDRHGPACAAGTLSVQAQHVRHLADVRRRQGRPADELDQRAARLDRARRLIEAGHVDA